LDLQACYFSFSSPLGMSWRSRVNLSFSENSPGLLSFLPTTTGVQWREGSIFFFFPPPDPAKTPPPLPFPQVPSVKYQVSESPALLFPGKSSFLSPLMKGRAAFFSFRNWPLDGLFSSLFFFLRNCRDREVRGVQKSSLFGDFTRDLSFFFFSVDGPIGDGAAVPSYSFSFFFFLFVWGRQVGKETLLAIRDSPSFQETARRLFPPSGVWPGRDQRVIWNVVG